MPSRRRYLATLGAGLVPGAGCLSWTGEPDGTASESPTWSTSSPTDGPNGTTTEQRDTRPSSTRTEPSPDIVLDDVVVRKSITYTSVMGPSGVLAAEDRQYVVASVRSDRGRPDSAFTFETDEGSWSHGLDGTRGATNAGIAGRDGWPVDSHGGTGPWYVAFDVPSPLTVTNARISGPAENEWPLSDAARDRLSAPEPRFELDSLGVPPALSQGDPLQVSLTVTNVSKTDGRFLAAVYWPTELIEDDDESHTVDREIPAGETVTATIEIAEMITAHTRREDGMVPLSVRGHVTADHEVYVWGEPA